ncbi:MAG TPA: DUF4912 domain-containing protein [Pyrinomonadaceae bacterium]|nr:DUF4912 domain-containing protein [Pyrinomonadaceae bacterium]
MNLRTAGTLEEASATDSGSGAHATAPAPDALADLPCVVLKRDFIQLLLQSPHRLYLYWTFARDPHAILREAFGELAVHYQLAVRLIKVESGEEFLLDAPGERAQWFEVFPQHVYRAEVGFHAPGRPFVRLLSSNIVTTPPDRASHFSDTNREFELQPIEFAHLLGGAGYERYARGLAAAAASHGDAQSGASGAVEPQGARARLSRAAADEYPHR